MFPPPPVRFGAPAPFSFGAGGPFHAVDEGDDEEDEYGNPVYRSHDPPAFSFGGAAATGLEFGAGAMSSLHATAEAAKLKAAKAEGGSSLGVFSFKKGAIIGVGVDLDAGTMWWSLNVRVAAAVGLILVAAW